MKMSYTELLLAVLLSVCLTGCNEPPTAATNPSPARPASEADAVPAPATEAIYGDAAPVIIPALPEDGHAHGEQGHAHHPDGSHVEPAQAGTHAQDHDHDHEHGKDAAAHDH
jgi:hypothetical protein